MSITLPCTTVTVSSSSSFLNVILSLSLNGKSRLYMSTPSSVCFDLFNCMLLLTALCLWERVWLVIMEILSFIQDLMCYSNYKELVSTDVEIFVKIENKIKPGTHDEEWSCSWELVLVAESTCAWLQHNSSFRGWPVRLSILFSFLDKSPKKNTETQLSDMSRLKSTCLHIDWIIQRAQRQSHMQECFYKLMVEEEEGQILAEHKTLQQLLTVIETAFYLNQRNRRFSL